MLFDHLEDMDTTMSSSTVYNMNLPPLAHHPGVNGRMSPEDAARQDRQVTHVDR